MFCQKVGSNVCFKSNMSYTAALKICLSSAYCYSSSLAQANPLLLFNLTASEASSCLCHHPLWRVFPFFNYGSWISPSRWLWGKKKETPCRSSPQFSFMYYQVTCPPCWVLMALAILSIDPHTKTEDFKQCKGLWSHPVCFYKHMKDKRSQLKLSKSFRQSRHFHTDVLFIPLRKSFLHQGLNSGPVGAN